jgi:2-oxoglutarate ferredoxin oxidoreductase subunit beta
MAMKQADELRTTYLREAMMPTIFCDGCGIGNVLTYTLWALDDVGIDMDRLVVVSGIGCSSRLSGYVSADGLHTTHGRALAFATGVKAANPDLHVLIFTGDGDGAGIGGNHLLHAIRRNMDMTVVLVNNYTYGMTGGQLAPTTPIGSRTTTTPYGNVEHPLNVGALAVALGAPYVARWPVTFPYQPIQSIAQGFRTPGFALVELLAPCPTAYGRKNRLGELDEQWTWYKDHTIRVDERARIEQFGTAAERAAAKELIPIGVLQQTERATWNAQWQELVERLRLRPEDLEGAAAETEAAQ